MNSSHTSARAHAFKELSGAHSADLYCARRVTTENYLHLSVSVVFLVLFCVSTAFNRMSACGFLEGSVQSSTAFGETTELQMPQPRKHHRLWHLRELFNTIFRFSIMLSEPQDFIALHCFFIA